MKKTTFKTYLTLLLVFLLSVAVMLTAFACNNNDDDVAEVPEETDSGFESLVTNGDFSTFTSSDAQPYSPSSWTEYTTSGTTTDNKVAGVIDTGADYDANRSSWGDLANPYGAVTANKVLMIYNKAENVFGYKASFDTSANAYYSVSVKVKVLNVDDDHGATIYLSSDNGFIEFNKVNGTEAFTTYTFYVQSPCVNSSITVRLSLGYDEHKVQGYAFFDDVVATKITKKNYDDATESATVKKASMLYPAGDFNYYTFDSSATALNKPIGWTWSNGANVSGKAVPTSDRYTGVISTATAIWDTVKDNYGDNPELPEGANDDYVMMIVKKGGSDDSYSPTAGYYAAQNKISIERSTLYEISVWVKAIVTKNSDDDKGARVVLKGSDTYESAIVNTTTKLSVNKGWAKVTFYVLGNQFRSQDFSLQLWMGNDKANNTLMQGQAFFDGLEIKPIQTVDSALRDTVVAEYEAKKGSFQDDYVSYVDFVDLKTENEKLIVNYNLSEDDLDATTGLPNTLDMGPVDNVKINDGDVITKVIPLADLTAEDTNWKEKYGIDENPLYPYSFAPVLIVNNVIPCAYEVKTKELFEIKQSLSYRISVWIKTIGLEEDKTITLKLVDDKDTTIESFTVNTSSYENEATNNYAEYCFYLTGEMPTNPDGSAQSNFARIVISNGSGTQYDPSSYQKGAFLLANINMEQITYTDYKSNNSGSYSKSKDYASNDSTVTNGNFNTYDRESTTFDDNGFVAMEDKDHKANLTGAIASWTNNVTESYGITKVEGEWLRNEDESIKKYEIRKVESGADNDKKEFTADIQGKTITTIVVTGTFEKTYESNTAWNKVFDINMTTGKFEWSADNSLDVGLYRVEIKVGSDWLATTYEIKKVDKDETNDKADFTVDAVVGNEITAIKLTSDFNKTYIKDTEWNKVFSIDTITGEIKWNNSNSLNPALYEVQIKVDEKELNDLIAGIINVNATPDYLNQFGLTAEDIYNQWSAEASDETKAKDVKFGAPNLLMITTRSGVPYITLENTVLNGKPANDMTGKPALKSPSMSLSANSFYHFKCYGKALNDAVGQVYVTTTSTDTKVTHHDVDLGDGWVEYNFYVETGLSSVTAYFEIYYGEKGNGKTHYSGTLLFDSFSYVSMTEEEYLATNETNRATFSTITFDNTSASETAVSPSGFSATNSSSRNVDEQVSGIIARDRYAYKTSDGKNNLGIYTTKTESDETTTEVLEEGSALSASEIFSSEGMEDGAEVGDYLLMINNRKDSYQSYYLSSLSLASDSCYKFSAYVRTAKIAKGSYAKVYVSISDEPITFEVNTEYDKDGNAVANQWKKLTFYYKNEKDSSVNANLYFELGKNTDEGKMKGYLFIDNVSVSKITTDEYNAAATSYETYEKDENDQDKLDENGEKILSAASVEYRLSNKVTLLEKDETTETPDDDSDNEEDADKEEGSSLNTTLLWTYITSIAIAVVLIAVIVVWLIKKYRRPKAATSEQKKADYDRTNKKAEESEPEKKTGSARDEYKD